MRFIMISILFLISAINAHAEADQKLVLPEVSLYGQASAKLAAIPKNYNEAIANILKNGWKENANIIKLINNNSASLELFKKAILEKSDGYILGRGPDKFDIFSRLPDYSKFTQLFKLLLLEGRLKEAKGLQKEAEEDYLAAAGFMIHVSQQRYGIMVSVIVNSLCLDLANACFGESFPGDALYRDNLLNNLRKLKSNQDFLESAFREEAQGLKNTARTLEAAAKKGATFEELFQISAIDGADKEQVKKYRERSKELTAMLDGKFFSEFYNQVDFRIDEFTSAAILAAKENNAENYKNKIKDFQDSIDKTGKPLNYLLWSLNKAAVEGKEAKLIAAETMANVFLRIAVPDFSKAIEKYWSFYNRLNALIITLQK
ncbi:MAG: hypothetical protein M0R66_08170 [Candidatus Omnitrophica bacterium]|nr:hypothetical protein [Candidatus Omnitrophota bacterium]